MGRYVRLGSFAHSLLKLYFKNHVSQKQKFRLKRDKGAGKGGSLFLPSLQKSLFGVKNKYYDHDKKNYKLLTNLLRQRKPLALHASIRGPDGKGINETKDKWLSWKIISLKYE